LIAFDTPSERLDPNNHISALSMSVIHRVKIPFKSW